MKIAFQGERGAYSEEAIHNYFKEEIQPIGFELSEQAFSALINKEVAMAVLPVENSIVGNVNVNLDLIFELPVYAIAEIYIPIRHHLLGCPGTDIKKIKFAYSHPIALAQCRNYLNSKEIKAIADYDTAGSCKLLKQRGHSHEAAIGPALCAQTYGLEVLSDNIQNVDNNFTRFLVLIRDNEISESLRQNKTSIAFMAGHKPGSLLDCLQIFKKYDINLTKLESRPIASNPFEYTFFVDFQNGILETKTQACLRELRSETHHLKILGSYPEGARPKRS